MSKIEFKQFFSRLFSSDFMALSIKMTSIPYLSYHPNILLCKRMNWSQTIKKQYSSSYMKISWVIFILWCLVIRVSTYIISSSKMHNNIIAYHSQNNVGYMYL